MTEQCPPSKLSKGLEILMSHYVQCQFCYYQQEQYTTSSTIQRWKVLIVAIVVVIIELVLVVEVVTIVKMISSVV